ncbi:hypothetical protein C1752_00936 [Acaryochloris thomasi RCC1774]|uniref:Uncharacterized protein n=1 Tax=Acaryochloris thomasi RCC1774 TaxID=1764569 RepID=A0A2W1K4S8_9CYAN|nr:hypothetical protein C1752_00936 [Acaryochloris thomasi RCC1774]
MQNAKFRFPFALCGLPLLVMFCWTCDRIILRSYRQINKP